LTIEESPSTPLDQDSDVVASVTEASKENRKRKDSKKAREKAKDRPIEDLEERYSNQRIEEESPKRKRKAPKITPSESAPNPTFQQVAPAKPAEASSKDTAEDGNSDEDADAMNLVHESVSGITPVTRRKPAYVPEGEMKTDRDERTIFIGNLPFAILKSKVCV
jgi:nucleolar protein 12